VKRVVCYSNRGNIGVKVEKRLERAPQQGGHFDLAVEPVYEQIVHALSSLRRYQSRYVSAESVFFS